MKPARRSPGSARHPLARTLAFSCALAFTAGIALPPAAALDAETETRGSNTDPVSLNFVIADIGAVIQAISKISGRNFIADPRVKGTLNIVTARPVQRELTLLDPAVGAAPAGLHRDRRPEFLLSNILITVGWEMGYGIINSPFSSIC